LNKNVMKKIISGKANSGKFLGIQSTKKERISRIFNISRAVKTENKELMGSQFRTSVS
jgi:hypothetical protein